MFATDRVTELEQEVGRLYAENQQLKKDVVEARQWAEKWQGLAHELGADIQQAAEVLAHYRALAKANGDE